MKVEKLVLNCVYDLRTNCYIVTKNDKSIIIDPGGEANRIIDFCRDKNVVGILITHHHPDHIGALQELEDFYGIKASVEIDGFNFQVLKTPGHASDSLTYYFFEDNIMFTGDFLFYHTIGRTDLPTSSVEEMKNSLEMISKFPLATIIYPGHGKSTILKEEVSRFNTYFE